MTLCSTVGRPTFGSYFGSYDGPIYYQNVTCSGPYNCSMINATDPSCNSERIAGVMCVNGEKERKLFQGSKNVQCWFSCFQCHSRALKVK